MKKHFIYILTNSNRTYLEIGHCNDINTRIQEIKDPTSGGFTQMRRLNSIVHIEEYTSYDDAQRRKKQLQQYTRMQRERLVRLKNPNWLNLQSTYTGTGMQHKKAVVYAS